MGSDFRDLVEERLIYKEALAEAAGLMCASRLLVLRLGLAGYSTGEIAKALGIPKRVAKLELEICASAIRPR